MHFTGVDMCVIDTRRGVYVAHWPVESLATCSSTPMSRGERVGMVQVSCTSQHPKSSESPEAGLRWHMFTYKGGSTDALLDCFKSMVNDATAERSKAQGGCQPVQRVRTTGLNGSAVQETTTSTPQHACSEASSGGAAYINVDADVASTDGYLDVWTMVDDGNVVPQKSCT
jgi:hypothetical protein